MKKMKIIRSLSKTPFITEDKIACKYYYENSYFTAACRYPKNIEIKKGEIGCLNIITNSVIFPVARILIKE